MDAKVSSIFLHRLVLSKTFRIRSGCLDKRVFLVPPAPLNSLRVPVLRGFNAPLIHGAHI